MKPVTFVLLFFVIISCSTKTATPTDLEKEQIKKELKSIVAQIVENIEKNDVEKAMEPYSDTPGFLHIISTGQVVDYNGFREGNIQNSQVLESQNFSPTGEKFTFLDNETVLITWTATVLAKIKNGPALRIDPFTATLVFKKIDSRWRIIYSHESSQVPNSPAPETSEK